MFKIGLEFDGIVFGVIIFLFDPALLENLLIDYWFKIHDFLPGFVCKDSRKVLAILVNN